MDRQKIIYYRKIKYNISNSGNFKVYLLQIIPIFDNLVQINYKFIVIVYIYIYIYICTYYKFIHIHYILYILYIYYIYTFPSCFNLIT